MFSLVKKLNLHTSVVSPHQFAIFRIIFAIYLIVHFAMLIPYAGELFSADGVLPHVRSLPSFGLFPNVLFFLTSAFFAKIFICILLFLSVFVLVGKYRRICALLLWFGWACLLNRNPFISNPGIPMVGWLLIALVLIPNHEPLSLQKNKNTENSTFVFPTEVYWIAWFILALGYTISGIHKLGAPSWLNGAAIQQLLQNPLARDVPWRQWLLNSPEVVVIAFSYFSLALEVLFFPLALIPKTRKYIWFAVLCMQLGILCIINFADLTFGVLMMHFFVFDRTWLASKKSQEKVILYFDGVCGLCNGLVDFIQIEEQNNNIYFSPLQSEFAQKNLNQFLKDDKLYDTSFLQDATGVYQKSDAILRLCLYLGGIWKLFFIFNLVPKKIRNFMYDFIAKHRYKFFGIKEACRMPTAQERQRFLN